MGEPNGSPRSRGDGGSGGGFDMRGPRWLIWSAVLLGILVLFVVGRKGWDSSKQEKLDWKGFLDKLYAGEMATCEIQEQTYSGKYEVGHKEFDSYICTTGVDIHQNPQLQEALTKNTDKWNVEPSPFWRQMLIQILFWLLLFAFIWYIFFRRLGGAGGAGGMLSFGKSRARLYDKSKMRKSFEDVAGIEEAKEEVQEIIEFLKSPAKFQRLGGRIPKGVLLVGAPGCGKTLLAKAIAGEAGVPFFTISGSDFVEMFVGVGASRVRDLFQTAKESSPCIIFLDEIDAVGRRRGAGLGGGHDEREQTLNAILVEMDGFDSNEQVIIMAATNRPDVLDPALLRPGRFDRHITIDLPDIRGREEILKVHARKVKLGGDIDFTVIARATPTFTGADLENMINESALIAVMRDLDAIGMPELEEARDKVLWGKEKRSRVMDEKDRKIIAYHESGHALASYLLPAVDPLHKVTILPRGVALGATLHLPEKDEYTMSRSKLVGQVKGLYAGRVAEELFVEDISTGAQNDIERATSIIRRMVCKFGMSEKLGPLTYGADREHVFLGHEIGRGRDYSEDTGQQIDQEVRRISTECYGAARDLLRAHEEEVRLIAEELLVKEVLTADEVDVIIKGERPAEGDVSSAEPTKAEAAEEDGPEAEIDVGDVSAGDGGDE